MVMKNRPSRMSWNGRMSDSTWCLYSVSEMSIPATKAPSASDRPASSVSQASPSVTSSRFRTNSSSLLRRATRVSHQRITRWPPVSSSPIRTAALSAARPSATSSVSGGLPRAGISTSSGTTARSWNSSTPITRLPCSVSSSSRSDSSFTTIAVLLMATAPASAMAVRQSMPHRPGAASSSSSEPPVPSTIVSSTCAWPNPNTWRRMARSLCRLNSRPMTNIRKTTPNSPRCRTISEFSASARALGPISTPTTR